MTTLTMWLFGLLCERAWNLELKKSLGAVVIVYWAVPVRTWKIKTHREMQTVEAWFIRNENSAKSCNQSYSFIHSFIQYFGKVSVYADHAWAEEAAGTVKELSPGCLPNHTVQVFRLPHWTIASLLFSLSPNTSNPLPYHRFKPTI